MPTMVGEDEDEVTSQEGEELMFGLDFASLKVSDVKDEDTFEGFVSKTGRESEYDPSLVECLLTLQHDLPPATEADFFELFAWATEHGARLDKIFCQKDTHGGRGLYSLGPMNKGDIIAVLPRPLRIGQMEACRVLKLPWDTPDLTALSLLVLWYYREGHVYSKSLPRLAEFQNAILLTPEEELSWSAYTEYMDAIRNFRSRAEGCRKYIETCLASEGAPMRTKTINWAISMVKSRSHAFGSKHGYWLTPVFDLLNHCPTPNAVIEGDDQGQLVCKEISLVHVFIL